MLTNAAWERAARSIAAEEKWVFYLYYDDGDPDGAGALKDKFIAVSDSSFLMGGVQVWGFVKTMPQIRGSISLPESKAKVENVTLALYNREYHGLPLSDELGIDGTRRYLNRKVQVFSYMPTAGSSLLIHHGWLREAPHNDEEISLAIEPREPWDNVKAPTVADKNGRIFTLAYGDFTPNTSTEASPNYCPSMSLFPCPVAEWGSTTTLGLVLHSPANCRPHLYNEAAEKFVPIVDDSDAYQDTAAARDGGYAVLASSGMRHSFRCKPAEDSIGATTFSDPANAIDGADDEASTYALDVVTTTLPSGVPGVWYSNAAFFFQLPQPAIGMPDGATVIIRYRATRSVASPTADIRIKWDASETSPITLTPDGADHEVTVTIPAGTQPTNLKVYFVVNGSSATDTLTIRLYDVRLTLVAAIDPASDEQARASALADIKTLYCGGDGIAKSWDSGAATLIHEMHRDMLIRFCGVSTTAPDGWTELAAARAGWPVRWWATDAEKVRDVLEKAQFEGAFIYLPGLTDQGRYVFVKASYTAGDEVATLREGTDTGQIEWKHTPFGDLKTKRTIRYQRHPADDSRYLQTYDYENSAARTAWAIKDEENVETSDLDMLVDGVDEHAAVYGAICGTIKKGFRTTIKTPRLWLLEKGDVVKVAPKRGTEARFFMVTATTREVMGLEIEAWEVG